MRPRFWAYLGGIARNVGAESIAIGGTEDHVHLLLALPATVSIAKTVNLLKSNSSKWLNERDNNFAWQLGYAAFSVSVSNIPAVKKYIREQGRHHRKRDFKNELRLLLQKHGIEFDERYLFN